MKTQWRDRFTEILDRMQVDEKVVKENWWIFDCQKWLEYFLNQFDAVMCGSGFYLVKGGCFAKKVRNKLIKLPCQIVRHARRLTVRLAPRTLEVMERILKIMNEKNSKVYETKFT